MPETVDTRATTTNLGVQEHNIMRKWYSGYAIEEAC